MSLRVSTSWLRLLPAVIVALSVATNARAQVYAPTIHTVSIDDGENLRPGSTMTLRFNASAGSLPLESITFSFVNLSGSQRSFVTRTPQDGVLTVPVTEDWLNGIHRLNSVSLSSGLMSAFYTESGSFASALPYAVPPGPSETLFLTRFVVSGGRAYVKPTLTAVSRTGAAEVAAGVAVTVNTSISAGSAAVRRITAFYNDPNGLSLTLVSTENPTQFSFPTAAQSPNGSYALQSLWITDTAEQTTTYFRNGRIDNQAGSVTHSVNLAAGDVTVTGGLGGTFVFPEILTFTVRNPQVRAGETLLIDYTLAPGSRPLKTVQFTLNGPISVARVVSTSAASSGTATLTLPASMVSGRYTLDRIDLIDVGDYQTYYQSNGLVGFLPTRLRQARNHGLSLSSASFTLTGGIAPIPVISEQPKDVTVEPGRSAELRANFATPVGAAVQWYEGAAGDTRKPVFGSGTALTVYPVTNTSYWMRATNAYGSADTRVAAVSPRFTSPLPVFLSQAPNISRAIGNGAIIDPGVVGPGPLTYIWYKDGLPIAGATEAQLALGILQAASGGTYNLVVSNPQGSVRSEPVHVVVEDRPRILSQTPSVTVRAGERVTFAVTAEGGALNYSWGKENTSFSGPNGSTFTIESAEPDNNGVYTCYIYNFHGSALAEPMVLTVIDRVPPRIVSPINDIYVVIGDPIGVPVGAVGNPLTYGTTGALPPGSQWSEANRALTGRITQVGNYPVTFTAGNRAGVSSRTVTIRVLPGPYAPIFLVQPRSQQAYADQRVTLLAEVAASSGTFNPIGFQWSKNGAVLSGQRSNELVFQTVRPGDAGTYTVEVRNIQGVVFSQPAMLTVLPAAAPPAITVPPRSQRVVPGATVVFSVIVGSAAPVTYQWMRNSMPLPGATGSSLTLTGVEAPQAGDYTVEVGNVAGTVRSSAAVLALDEVVSGHLKNLSVRSYTAAGARTLIAGFAIAGARPKPMLMRVVGPTLSQFGLNQGLPNPRLMLASGARTIDSNDNWSSTTGDRNVVATAARLGAFALPSASPDSAMAISLDAGAYSVLGGSADTLSGLALIELYDADEAVGRVSARLINVSARSLVGTGAEVLIAGFVVAGQTPCRLLVRGIGPGLAGFGVGGALARPRLQVFSGVSMIAENNDWTARAAESAAAAQSVGAFALSPANADAALLTSLNPGAYTVILSGLGGTTGIGLIELYALP